MTVRQLINGKGQAVAAGIGAAAGGVTLWTLLNKLSPEQLVELAKSPVAGYFIITAGAVGGFLYVGSRLGGQLVDRLDLFVAEQAKLAGAVETIAGRDDRRAQSQDLLLNHLARTAERTEAKVDAMQAQVKELTHRG